MQRMRLLCVLAAAWFAAGAEASSPSAPPPAPPAAGTVADLPAVVVTGVQPGPGLWKVTRPGSDHVLWLLGTLTPLPRDIEWQSPQLEAVEQRADALLGPPGISVGVKAGFFGSLALLPRLVGVRNNPDHRRLAEVLPAADAARWQALKAKYLGRGRKVEKFRPAFAGMKLRAAAAHAAGLTETDTAGERVAKLAKKRKLPHIDSTYQFTLTDPKAALQEFKTAAIDDLPCFRALMDSVEQRLPAMQQAANAWAVGDLATLATLPPDPSQLLCVGALGGADFARKRGVQDIDARVQNSWLEAVDKTFAEHHETLGTIGIFILLAPDGYVAALRARGYVVEAPQG